MKIHPEHLTVKTTLGDIAVYRKAGPTGKTPLIFLHGVYLDHHLWDDQVDEINDRTVVTVDMPFHGASRSISNYKWSLNDCADMLIEILDGLNLHTVIAIGHSWGSMTILRAAHRRPKRFEGVLLCNMPFQRAGVFQKTVFRFQHTLLPLREFYMTQAAKSLFSTNSLRENPGLMDRLKKTMRILSNRQIKWTDKAVILDADDSTDLIRSLKVKAIALKGLDDYVPTAPQIESVMVQGGHISPLEAPKDVLRYIKSILN
jgi:3-oxoadipate enol-lactonase